MEAEAEVAGVAAAKVEAMDEETRDELGVAVVTRRTLLTRSAAIPTHSADAVFPARVARRYASATVERWSTITAFTGEFDSLSSLRSANQYHSHRWRRRRRR